MVLRQLLTEVREGQTGIDEALKDINKILVILEGEVVDSIELQWNVARLEKGALYLEGEVGMGREDALKTIQTLRKRRGKSEYVLARRTLGCWEQANE